MNTFTPAIENARGKGSGSWLRNNRTFLLLLPTLGLFLAFLLMPYLNMIVMSFRNPSTRQVFAPGFTIANYFEAIFDADLYYLEVLCSRCRP